MDLADYQSRVEDYRRRRKAQEGKRDRLKESRDRLKRTYDYLSSQKDESKLFERDLQSLMDGCPKWRGERCNEFKEAQETICYGAEENTRSIDGIMDDINLRIMECNNQIYATNTKIDDLTRSINWLLTTIRNWAN